MNANWIRCVRVLAVSVMVVLLSAESHGQTLGDTKIVFMSDKGQPGTFDLWTVTYSGLSSEDLTNDPANKRMADWSPDGARIAYASGGNVFVLDLSDSSVRQVTFDGGNDQPSWSPDGTEMVYHKEDAYEVYRIPTSGGTPVLVVTNGWQADWSPGGAQIAYSDIASPGTVFVVD